MTIWDNIYKNYKKGGLAWATLDTDEIDPEFKKFIESNVFSAKSVLDIGCGTGKYLLFLKNLGFKTTGIDSSKTSVEMTQDLLKENGDVSVADMFEYKIRENEFDLIISVSTIHHGLKKDINCLIDQIYNSLLPSGKIFITIPSLEGRLKWNTFKDDTKVGPGTFSPNNGPEKGLPHSFYSKEEIIDIFKDFKNLKIDLDRKSRWIITGTK